MAKTGLIMANKIEARLNGSRPILVYRGMSGTAMATAVSLMATTDVGMVYARKKTEKCHSSDKAVFRIPRQKTGEPLPVLVFVDDFISTGKTKRETMEAATIALCKKAIPFQRDFYFTAVAHRAGRRCVRVEKYVEAI
jgi:orotate phosphoribosyltransferase